MNSAQYEELCRRFIADMAGLSPDAVQSLRIPNPRRPGLPEYQHQIDLRWETGSEIASYVNIANAKWRASAKIDQPDVMLLQQARQKVGAHKAFLITNIGFTAGALAAAKDDGIGLHVVVPSFDVSTLPKRGRAAMQESLQALAASGPGAVYDYRVEHRGLGFSGGQVHDAGIPSANAARVVSVETRVIGPTIRAVTSPPSNRSRDGGDGRRSPIGNHTTSGGPGGFIKR